MRRTKKSKSLSSLKKKAWSLFSLLVRKSAADRRGIVICYTCGAIIPWQVSQASHAIGGRHNAVLFDEDLVRVCCVRCNIYLRGNYPVFILKLINEHSADWFEKKLAGSHQIVKWTTSDMRERIKCYELRLKRLD